MANSFLKFIITAILFILGFFFFPQTGGPLSGLLFLGGAVLGSNLSADATNLINLIFAFIITAAIYYFIATLLTVLLMRLFGR